MEITERRGPGRPPKSPQQEAFPSPAQQPATSEEAQQPSQRAIEVRNTRRRREMGDVDVMARQRLAIPPEIQDELKAKGLTPRWVLNSPGRIKQLQAEDWDFVPGVERVAAARESESEHILMFKRKDWYDEDRRYLTDLNKDREQRATKQRGDAAEVDTFADSEGSHQADHVYGPRHTRNRISLAEGRQIKGA